MEYGHEAKRTGLVKVSVELGHTMAMTTPIGSQSVIEGWLLGRRQSASRRSVAGWGAARGSWGLVRDGARPSSFPVE